MRQCPELSRSDTEAYMREVLQHVGRLVALRRDRAGLHQTALADLAGVDHTRISDIELARLHSLTASYFAVFKALKLQPWEVLPPVGDSTALKIIALLPQLSEEQQQALLAVAKTMTRGDG